MADSIIISRKLAAFNAFAAAGARLLNVGVLLWYQHRLLKSLDPSEFSFYPIVTALLFIFSFLTTIFVNPAQRYVTHCYAKGDRDSITEIVSSLIPPALISGLLFGLFGGLITIFVDSIFVVEATQKLNAQIIIAVMIIGAVGNLILRPLAVGFFAQQKLAAFHFINLMGEIVRLLLLATLLFLFGEQILWVVVVDAVVSLAVATILTVFSRRMIPELRFQRKSFSYERMMQLVKFGLKDTGTNVARIMHNCIPIWLLNRYSSPVDVTSFHLGISAFRQAQKVWIPVRGSLGPPMIAFHAKEEFERMRRWYYKGSKFALWAILFAVTPLIIYRNSVIELYAGSQYADGATVLMLLLLRYPMQMVNALLPQLVRAQGKPGRFATIAIAAECVLSTCLFIGIWKMGYGAIFASAACLCVSLLFELFANWPLAIFSLGGRFTDSIKLSLLPGIVPAILSAAIWSISNSYLDINSWMGLVIAGIPGALAYIVTVIVLLAVQEKIRLPNLLLSRKKDG